MKAEIGLAARMCLLSICLLAAASSAIASTDKSQYNLFNPTPRDLMRELSADRPDVTESPYTVDAGHVQLEMSFVDFVYDNTDGVRTRQWTVAPFNLKVGLLNNVDLQFVADSYVHTEVEDGADQIIDGFGNTQLRLKINLWGNDAGDSALAVMPFVSFPTGPDELSGNQVEGGLIIPLAIVLPAEFDLGLMAEFDFVYDDEDDDYTVECVHTAALSHDIVGALAGYIEYIGVLPFESGRGGYQASIGTGLTYGLNDNAQLDFGMIFGLTDEADDFNVFTGITVRR